MTLFDRSIAKCGQLITLQDRDITPPNFGISDFDLNFSNNQDVKAVINTKRGKTIFDGVTTDQPITHRLAIKFILGITSETWVLLKNRRLDIIDVENIGELDKCLILLCNERGLGDAAKA